MQNSDSVDSVTLSSAGAEATASVAGGPYSIAVSAATGNAFDATNYQITYDPGTLTVDKADAIIDVTPYSTVYNTTAQTATGVLGESLSGLDLSGTTHTNAGDYTGDAWTFTDTTGNYNNASGTVDDGIAKADAIIDVTPYSTVYNTTAQTATGTATGVLGESLSGLDVSGTTHTDAGDYSDDTWTFTDTTGNYNDASGTVNDVIAKADTKTQPGATAGVLAIGQKVTLTATVTAVAPGSGTPSGMVTFMDDTNTLGTVTLVGGAASLALPVGLAAGSYAIGVSYSGDGNFNVSTGTGTLLVAAPAVTAPTCACNCGCPNSPGSVAQTTANTAGFTVSFSSPNPVRYSDGVVTIALTDLYSTALGFPWAQTRSWTNGPGYAANGSNGVGWVDTYTPQLIEADGSTMDTLVVINNGTSASYFDLVDGVYQARFDSPSQLSYDSGTDVYTLIDGDGDVITFTGFSTDRPAAQRGEFASYTDAATGQSIAVTSYTDNGNIAEEQGTTTSGGSTYSQSWVYTYLPSTDPNAGLLSNVTLRAQVNGGSWTVLQQVQYAYYDGTQNGGNLGDLMTATVENAGGTAISTSYYRYYTAGEASYQHGLEYVVNPASYALMTAAYGTDLSSLSDSQVGSYADYYFQYDSSFRISEEVVAGAGTYTYSYTASTNSPGENSWATKTVVTGPDGSSDTVYTNAYAQVMLDVHYDAASGVDTVTFYAYNSAGQMVLMANPSAVTGYNASYADLLDSSGSSYAYLNDSSGLITTYDYYSSTTATATTAGGVAGYQQEEFIQQGQDGTPIPQETWQYYAVTVGGQTIAPLATDTVYRNTDGTGAETTSYTYTFFTGTAQMQTETVSAPVVTAAQNGPDTADVTTTVFNALGQPIWVKDPDGYLEYMAYDPATGAQTLDIQDVNTADTSEFTDKPTGWTTPTGGGLNLVTQDQVDDQGRTTEETDPDGNVSYAVYLDAQQEVRVYPGWNSTTDTTTGPTQVSIDDPAGGFSETLTMSATPSVTDGAPNGSEAIGDLQSLTVDVTNAAGQVIAEDDYFNLSGLTFAPGVIGTEGVNYYQTSYGYDALGNLDRTETPNGTIYRSVYDSLGDEISAWVGTNDAGATDRDPTGGGATGNNMVETTAWQCDNGGVGDGNLTQETDFVGGDAANRVTQYFYDWRDRLVATKSGVQSSEDGGVNRPIVYTTYDNLDEAVEVQQYAGDGVSITTSDGVPQAPDASLLRAQTVYAYDNQGRVYQTQVYDVNPTTGDVSTYALTTNYYYDHRGDLVAESDPGGLWTKSVYDGAGRDVMDYTTDGGSGTTWAEALSVSGDTVLEQVQTVYDGDGDAIESIDSQRFDNATGTGPLGSPTSGIGARVYYTATYYDAADRPTADVNVGTNGGSAWTRPDTAPSASATVLVTSYDYNAAGWLQDVIDPMGIDTRTDYDALGQTTEVVQNYTGGAETSDSDVATQYGYDGDGNVVYVKADEPGGAYQETAYVYGVTTAGGSTINSNDLLAAVDYPDPSTGAPSSSQAVAYSYNTQGQMTSMTDRNGTTHQYSYDVLGRLTSDAVTTLGSGVDGSVRRIDYAYDQQGNQYLITSYDAASGGDVVNQVEDVYNGLGQLTAEYQSNAGAVDTSTTPVVQYAYTEMAGGVNNSRLTSITYPSGYVLDYNYGSSGSLNDTISRLDSLSDSTGTLESYKYLGLDTVVERDHPQTGINLTYISQTGSTGDAGDQYTGLDRFGRVVEQNWYDTTTSSSVDDVVEGYDPDGDVLYQENLVDAVFSQVFEYNPLSELTDFAQGTLNSDKTGLTGDASASQSWTPDALGNFTSSTTNGTTQLETVNQQNQITAISGAGTTSYDGNGNMTADGSGNSYVYDAWNRLVAVNNDGSTVASYSYDGLGRRITETHGSTTTALYFSTAGQVLEEQVGGVTQARNVWSPVYVNAMVLRDQSSEGDGVLDQRLYVAQDANWNVTALINTSGTVVERYVYNPYGGMTVLTGSWGSRTSSSYNWVYLFQGGRYDGASGLYVFGVRDYSPSLGRWMENDPLNFAAGQTNLQQYVGNDPTNATDPSGLFRWGVFGAYVVGGVVVGAAGGYFFGAPGLGAGVGLVAGVAVGVWQAWEPARKPKAVIRVSYRFTTMSRPINPRVQTEVQRIFNDAATQAAAPGSSIQIIWAEQMSDSQFAAAKAKAGEVQPGEVNLTLTDTMPSGNKDVNGQTADCKSNLWLGLGDELHRQQAQGQDPDLALAAIIAHEIGWHGIANGRGHNGAGSIDSAGDTWTAETTNGTGVFTSQGAAAIINGLWLSPK